LKVHIQPDIVREKKRKLKRHPQGGREVVPAFEAAMDEQGRRTINNGIPHNRYRQTH
jgi:hypothetical protein